jgi:GNAT superfamily N-acetyltransferase
MPAMLSSHLESRQIGRSHEIGAIDPSADAELSRALAILSDALGVGVFCLTDLAGLARGPSSKLIAARRSADRTIVAVGSAELIGSNLSYYTRFGPRVVERLASHRCGNLSSLGVARESRGQGLGSAVLDAQIAWLAEQRCDLAVAIAWMSNLPPTSHEMLERRGFNCLGEVPEFYLSDSLARGWSCPSCGGGCRCAGRLYVRELG